METKQTQEMTPTYKCIICKKTFEGYGNNPAPARFNGRCCDKCNREIVIPLRMLEMMSNNK